MAVHQLARPTVVTQRRPAPVKAANPVASHSTNNPLKNLFFSLLGKLGLGFLAFGKQPLAIHNHVTYVSVDSQAHSEKPSLETPHEQRDLFQRWHLLQFSNDDDKKGYVDLSAEKQRNAILAERVERERELREASEARILKLEAMEQKYIAASRELENLKREGHSDKVKKLQDELVSLEKRMKETKGQLIEVSARAYRDSVHTNQFANEIRRSIRSTEQKIASKTHEFDTTDLIERYRKLNSEILA